MAAPTLPLLCLLHVVYYLDTMNCSNGDNSTCSQTVRPQRCSRYALRPSSRHFVWGIKWPRQSLKCPPTIPLWFLNWARWRFSNFPKNHEFLCSDWSGDSGDRLPWTLLSKKWSMCTLNHRGIRKMVWCCRDDAMKATSLLEIWVWPFALKKGLYDLAHFKQNQPFRQSNKHLIWRILMLKAQQYTEQEAEKSKIVSCQLISISPLP